MGFFERIPRGAGLGRPLRFTLLLSLPMYLFLCLYPLIFSLMGLLSRIAPSQGSEPPFRWMALGCAGGILLVPFFQVLFIMLSGAIHCAALRLWGVHDPAIGAAQDLRAWTYAQGFMVLAGWTPVGPIAMLGVLVVAGMGYARMHGVPAWKGIAASLTHVFVVLGAVIAAIILFVILVVARESRGHSRVARPGSATQAQHPNSLNARFCFRRPVPATPRIPG
jgi:hypothetical protein